MKKLAFIILFLLIACEENQSTKSIKNPNVYSIGFGSCLTQERSMPIFNTIKDENYDLFLMIGDNVYGDSEREDLLELREAYDKQRQNFDNLNLNFPIEAIWDDHDYGLNDAGKEYAYKEDAEQLFLDFWNISQWMMSEDLEMVCILNGLKTIDGLTVQMLFLDTRFFRDALLPTDERGAPGKERYLPQTDTSLACWG
jgi:alkaline phosphatase D